MAENFPDAFLRPAAGFLYGTAGDYAMIVALHPFELDGQQLQTQITIDLPFDAAAARDLAGTTHAYADEDELFDSGVEGSVYIRHAHNPVLPRRIAFGPLTTDATVERIPVTIDCEIDFEFEGSGFANRPATIQCVLTCGTPSGPFVRSYRVIK